MESKILGLTREKSKKEQGEKAKPNQGTRHSGEEARLKAGIHPSPPFRHCEEQSDEAIQPTGKP